ncbi:MFS transporter, partial [Pseudomonas syringae pv. tagetis]
MIAKPGFNRWVVPPYALAIHLCIGMAYGFSGFWLPLSKAVGVTAPVAFTPDMGFLAQMFASNFFFNFSLMCVIYT